MNNSITISWDTPSGRVGGVVVGGSHGKKVIAVGDRFAVRADSPDKVAYFATIKDAEKWLNVTYKNVREQVFPERHRESRRETQEKTLEMLYGVDSYDDPWE